MGKNKDKTKGFDALPDGDKAEKTTTIKKGAKFVDAPAGDLFSLKENLGRLVVIEPLEIVNGFATTNGPADVIRGNVTVLTEDDGKTKLDEADEYEDTVIFGKAIFGSLKRIVGTGQLVVGVVGQGEKKGSNSAPWLILAASDKQKAIAEKHFSS
jgi:hypothetical protein